MIGRRYSRPEWASPVRSSWVQTNKRLTDTTSNNISLSYPHLLLTRWIMLCFNFGLHAKTYMHCSRTAAKKCCVLDDGYLEIKSSMPVTKHTELHPNSRMQRCHHCGNTTHSSDTNMFFREPTPAKAVATSVLLAGCFTPLTVTQALLFRHLGSNWDSLM